MLGAAYRHWMAEEFIDPRPKRESPLHLDQEPNELIEYTRRTTEQILGGQIAALLQSPRRLKHLIRRVDRVWRNLVGEVDLDDLIVASQPCVTSMIAECSSFWLKTSTRHART